MKRKSRFWTLSIGTIFLACGLIWFYAGSVNQSRYNLAVLSRVADIVNLENDATFEGLRDAAQAFWLRPKGIERWDVSPKFEDRRKDLLPLFKRLGLIDAIMPKHYYYDVIVINGGSVEAMRQRLHFLNAIWRQGIHARGIYFITGKRPIDPNLEGKDSLVTPKVSSVPWDPMWALGSKRLPDNEAEAADFVWDQVITEKDLKDFGITIISVGMIEKNNTSRRPNTHDTVLAWLDVYNPKGKKILNISDNPFIHYQDAVMRHVLCDQGFLEGNYFLETVGPASDKNVLVSVYLDTIGRTLYNEEAKKYAKE